MMALKRFISPSRDFFDFNLKYLFYVGLWPREDFSKRHAILYKLYEISLHVLSLIYVLTTSIGTYQHRGDFTVLLANLDKTLVAYNFVLKVVVFVLKRKQLERLIGEIISSGDRITYQRKCLMAFHMVAITVVTTATIGAFSLLALFKMEMIVEAWMPFDPSKNLTNYLMALEILVVSFIPCSFRSIAMQGIVCSIVMYFCDQYVDLQRRIKVLEYSSINEGRMRSEFGEILKKHSEGIAMAAYGTSWTSWPLDMQKNLLIVIRVAQKPLTLSAGGVVIMSMRAYSQDILECKDSMERLNALNEIGRAMLTKLREELDNLDLYGRESGDQKYVIELDAQRQLLAGLLREFKDANISSLFTIEKAQRDELLKSKMEGEDPVVRNRRKQMDKDGMLKMTTGVTEQLLSISRQLADTTQRSQVTLDSLVSSSSTVHGTQSELENTAGTISQSSKLLNKYGRREFTDKVIMFFAFMFFLAVCLYIVQKRLF
ncbi:unnamed protein product, partial [Iphiclides podalirius]